MAFGEVEVATVLGQAPRVDEVAGQGLEALARLGVGHRLELGFGLHLHHALVGAEPDGDAFAGAVLAEQQDQALVDREAQILDLPVREAESQRERGDRDARHPGVLVTCRERQAHLVGLALAVAGSGRRRGVGVHTGGFGHRRTAY